MSDPVVTGKMKTASPNRVYQAVSVFLFGAALCVGLMAKGMRFYTSFGPGPGFLPMFMAGILGILAVVLFIQSTWRPVELPPSPFGDSSWRSLGAVALVLFGLVAMAGLMEAGGFRLTATVFIFAMLRIFGLRSWWQAAAIAALFGFGAYFVFSDLLGVQLPAGTWLL